MLLSSLKPAIVRVASMIAGVAIAAVVVRLLGANAYAYYVLIITASTWLTVAALGTPERTIQELIRLDALGDHAAKLSLLKASLVYSGLGGIAAATISIVVLSVLWTTHGIDGWLYGGALLVLITSALTTPALLASSMLIANEQVFRDTCYKLVQPMLALGLAILLLPIGHWPSERLLFVVSASYALSLTVMRLWSLRELSLRELARIPVEWQSVAALARDSFPFLILQLAALAALQFDRFIVTAVGGLEDLASYDFLLRIYTAIYSIFFLALQPIWRRVGTAWAKRDLAQMRTTVIAFLVGSLSFWPFAIGMVTIGGNWVVMMFSGGRVTSPSWTVYLLAGIFFLVRGTTDVLTLTLYSMNQHRRTIPFIIAHGITNVAFGSAGGMIYGVPGMIAGQILSFALSTLLPFLWLVRVVLRDEQPT